MVVVVHRDMHPCHTRSAPADTLFIRMGSHRHTMTDLSPRQRAGQGMECTPALNRGMMPFFRDCYMCGVATCCSARSGTVVLHSWALQPACACGGVDDSHVEYTTHGVQHTAQWA